MNIFNTVFIAVLWIVPKASVEQKTITVESGQNVTLPCRAPNDKNDVVEWSRPDLTKPVLAFRNGKSIPDYQLPYFKNRAALQDKQMKGGDVSLILTNVTDADNGTYECRVQRDGDSSMQLTNTTYLRVVAPPGPGGGHGEDGRKEDGGKKDGRKEDRSALIIFLGGFIIIATICYSTWSSIKQKFETTFKAGRPARSSVIDI